MSRLREVQWRLRWNTRGRVTEDLVSVRLEKVKECGDQRAFPIVRRLLCEPAVPALQREVQGGVTPPSATLRIPSASSETWSRW